MQSRSVLRKRYCHTLYPREGLPVPHYPAAVCIRPSAAIDRYAHDEALKKSAGASSTLRLPRCA